MNERKWSLQFSFDIDSDRLSSLEKNECFVLGFELGVLYELAHDKSQQIEKIVHADNQDRIRRLMEKEKRQYKLTYMPNDVSEQWMQLIVFREAWVDPC